MIILILLIAALLVLDAAAILWGVDSREGPNDLEWERRREWRAFH